MSKSGGGGSSLPSSGPTVTIETPAVGDSVWSKLSTYVAEHKAVAYTVGAVVIVVTGGAVYYLTRPGQGGKGKGIDGTANGINETKSDSAKKKKKKSKKGKSAKDDKAANEAEPKAAAAAAKSATVEEEKALPDVTEESVTTFTAEERKEYAGKLKDAGNKAYGSKNYTQAIDLYTKAILCKPDPIYYSNRAACYNALSDWAAVIEDTSAAIKLNPEYVKALNRRANAYEQTNEFSLALLDYTASCIIDQFRNEGAAQSVERLLKKVAEEKGRKMLEGKKKKLPSPTFVTNYLQSFREKKLPEGLEEVTDEESGDFHLKHGITAIATNRTAHGYDDASASFEKALKLGVSDKYKALAYNMRGTFKYLKGLSAEAVEDLTESIKLDETLTQSYVKRASMSLELADKDAAEADFERAIKQNANDPDIYYHRAQLHFITAEYAEAAKDYQRSIDLDRDFIYSHIQLGVTQYKMGSVASSMATFRRCIKNFDKAPDVYNYYGELLLDQQKFDEAIQRFDTAIEMEKTLKPTWINVLPLINKALALFQWKQDFHEAENLCKNALIIDPDCDIAVATIAQLLLQQGRVPEALEYFEKAADLARTEGEIVNALSYAEATRTQLEVQEKYPQLAAKLHGGMGGAPVMPR